MSEDLLRPLVLPCGVVLRNRLAKAALTERLSDRSFDPSPRLVALSRLWAQSGAGLLITGNVMVDRRHLESAGNVVIEDERALDAHRTWAQSGAQLWMQLNHPGAQSSFFSAARPVSPSPTGRARELSKAEIENVIERFVRAARVAQRAGFRGVQVHAAHGYLLSQFLSPHTNRRTDGWGGSVAGRARLLVRIVRDIRSAVGSRFPISVKLNATDFREGGQREEDALSIARMLGEESVDLLEISGGSYENMAFLREQPERFVAFARRARAETGMALMVTGGFRTRAMVDAVLAEGAVDLIGMGRPFLASPTFGADFLGGRIDRAPTQRPRMRPRRLVYTAMGGFHNLEMQHLARNLPAPRMRNGWRCVLHLALHELASWAVKRDFDARNVKPSST
jgi:2,4-dienoyl-CoA reductase-like NADH-dependent reductase (Old Yellow Enzyme family)